jgi:hypothetical protein
VDGFTANARREFASYRVLAEKAMERVDDTGFFASPGPESNSIAVIVKHMAGNLRSRWTDFLTTDGEKPDRDRDGEFVLEPGDTREVLLARWSEGWQLVDETLAQLSDADVGRIVMVRWQPHTVLEAVHRQMTHAAMHAGQIIVLAKLYARSWESLSIPRGGSVEFNERLRSEAEATRMAGQARPT